ncbi:MAG: dTMP kinase, partial [Planctomycetia bacterium]
MSDDLSFAPNPRHLRRTPGGVFLSLDGVDGSGKTTQLGRLHAWLVDQGWDVVCCRDPGGTPVGEEIRDVLLNTKADVVPSCEALLYMASRAQLVETVIRPALKAGRLVLSDRYLLATVVYQGHAGGLEPDFLWTVGRLAVGGLEPDWTGVLDVSDDTAADRRGAGSDRMERKPDAYHRLV